MAKKDFGSESDPISGGAQKATAMGLPSLQEVDAQVFGNGIIPDSGQQVARPISLDQISPDPTQPRREVPSVVRNRARENNLPEWQMWHQMAERQLGHEIPLKALLRGEGEGAETEKSGMPLVDGFMALVALAASIFDKGLVNPITVSPRGMDQYMIETGERRYQAYRLLDGVLGLKKFSKIVANKVAAVDVWRQAAENGSRKPLNAIGMARQIALLIMALNDDKSYEPFEAFAGQSDRLFYAQVADGNTHRIPKGSSEKILQATGLKSRHQIAQYRALLDVSDDVWQQADEDDWAEGRIRETVRPISHTLTTVNVSPTNPPMSIKAGQGPGTKATGPRLLYRGKEVEYIDSEPRRDKTGMDVLIWHMDSSGVRTFSETVHSRETQDLPHVDIGKPSGGIDYDRLRRQALVKDLRLASGDDFSHEATLAAILGEDETDEAADNPLSIKPDGFDESIEENAPPAWAVPGATIRHKPSGEIGTIVFTIWDELELQWYVRAQKGPGDWADLPESECEPYIEAEVSHSQMERHPALHPSNLTRMVTDEQVKLGSLWSMGTDLKMPDEARLISRMKIASPSYLRTSLNEEGLAGAYAVIEERHAAGVAILKRELKALDAVRAEHREVLRQMALETQSS
mgnify:CR=1 FL=1